MNKSVMKKSLAAGIALAGITCGPAMAYGPLYIFDYESATPYRWDVSEPIAVYVDGGNFASGTVWNWVETPETCNAADGWQCGYVEEIYVEFTNEQGVARVDEALASWSAVPTSAFQAARAGSFADIGLGGDDGDITGADEEFTEIDGESFHEIVGTDNGGGIHVIFDEDGSVMSNVMGVPWGVLGIASPEWADEETGIITEGFVVIGGDGTYWNDNDLAQMAGVITHELGHSFNLAHSQVNGHVIMLADRTPAAAGPVGCSAHWAVGGDYRLPFEQYPGPGAEHISVMYPFVDNNPDSWNVPTGSHQATVDTAEDLAAISALYPAPNFASETGTISGSVTYPFGSDGIIGLNIVARNLDDPFADAISVMTGDWNDGQNDAAAGPGDFTLRGLTPGARYVVHVETIVAGGFPTPSVGLPGPSEYFNGAGESDDATRDDACAFEEIVLEAGQALEGIDIQINGVKKAPVLVINPAPSANQVSESGQVTAGTIASSYGDALSWTHHAGLDEHTIWPIGSLTLSENASIMAGVLIDDDNTYVPIRVLPGSRPQIIAPPEGYTACDGGSGYPESYSHYAISPNGKTIGGFLWDCGDDPNTWDYRVHAATWSETKGWSILDDADSGIYSRVNSLANDGTAAGWVTSPFGWRFGAVWKDGARVDLQTVNPDVIEVGEATAIDSNANKVIGIGALDWKFSPRSWMYDIASGELTMIDVFEPCSPFDWFCFGDKPFNAWDIADDGTLVGSLGSFGSASATLVNDVLGTQKLVDFLKAQGVINAADLGIASNVLKISNNGRHLVGWTATDGQIVSFRLTLDQLWVCRKGKSMQVGYPGGVADQLDKGASLGMCEEDLPLQYKVNY